MCHPLQSDDSGHVTSMGEGAYKHHNIQSDVPGANMRTFGKGKGRAILLKNAQVGRQRTPAEEEGTLSSPPGHFKRFI